MAGPVKTGNEIDEVAAQVTAVQGEQEKLRKIVEDNHEKRIAQLEAWRVAQEPGVAECPVLPQNDAAICAYETEITASTSAAAFVGIQANKVLEKKVSESNNAAMIESLVRASPDLAVVALLVALDARLSLGIQAAAPDSGRIVNWNLLAQRASTILQAKRRASDVYQIVMQLLEVRALVVKNGKLTVNSNIEVEKIVSMNRAV